MALPNSTKYRRYPFKRQLKRKLRKIAFMIVLAILAGGGSRYYSKYYNNDQSKKFQNTSLQNSKSTKSTSD